MGVIGGDSANQNLLLISLLLAVVLLIVQTLRLRRRSGEFATTTEALLKREKLATLGRMMAGIAHELNTPLGAVRCSVETRQRAVTMIDEAMAGLSAQGADQTVHLARVQKALGALRATDPVLNEALTRTNQLIRELRLAGRGEEAAPEPVDVNDMVQSTLLLLQHELRNTVDVKLELAEVRPVPGWPGPLGQVLLNLVLNARQALGESGTITISTAMDGDQVVVKVIDDGAGLPAGCADRLFKPGFTTKDSDEGTGLGLFITRKILDRHEGRIDAANGPHGGAEFTITLPTTRSDNGPARS